MILIEDIRISPDWNVNRIGFDTIRIGNVYSNITRLECKFNRIIFIGKILSIRISPDWNVNWLDDLEDDESEEDSNITRLECK